MSTIKEFITSGTSVYVNTGATNPQNCRVVDAIAVKWEWGNRWVMKLEWDYSIKIPRPYLPTKKCGLFLQAIFKLCERTHSFADNIPFKNACQWHQKIWCELTGIEIEMCLNDEIKPKDGSWKKGYIAIERERLKALRTNQNPFLQYQEATGLQTLIDTALKLKSQSNKYHLDYWLPFLRAYAAYIKDIETNYGHGYIEGSQYKISKGRGKSNANVTYREDILHK